MKNLMTMTIAAAALVAAAGMASAQTMEAKIPFNFGVNGKMLAAGTYRLQFDHTSTGNLLVVISNGRSSQRTAGLAFPNGDVKEAWRESGNLALAFRCAGDGCTLSDIWMGDGPVYTMPQSKLSGAAAERAEVIVMHPIMGE